MKIDFIWQGVTDREDHWNDGLKSAMRIVAKTHKVSYKEPWDEIDADLVLYWEAPVTAQGKNAPHYNRIKNLPIKKALLFAGGPIKREWVDGFDLLFVESKINEEECEQMGIKYKRAFGINTEVFKPLGINKIYDSVHHGACASWKRQWLLGEAFGNKGLVFGQEQESDPMPFLKCQELGCRVMGEQNYEKTNILLNQSKCLAQTSDYWGGGQRATLEAMAINIPVICMTDSPKNREFVEESGAGVVVEPDSNKIKEAYVTLDDSHRKGREYVLSKWTQEHYANNLLQGIDEI